MKQMLKFELDAQDLFDQLFVLGLASILDAETSSSTKIHWLDGGHAVIDAGENIGMKEAAAIVHAHAKRAVASPWLTTVVSLSAGERSPLSPRIGKLGDKEAFEELEKARKPLIDSIAKEEYFTRRMIGALGRPSDWAKSTQNEILPDAGASAWEMKTRNRGEEFIQNRLSLIGRAVAHRSVAEIEDGLTGRTLIDEVGKNKRDSRTPTGLRLPSPADNARAWCALWGISVFPVQPVVGAKGRSNSVTAGALREGGHVWFYLPVVDAPMSVAGFRAIARSRYLADQASVALALSDDSVTSKGVRWLEEHHTRQFFTFFRYKSDNKNAPEPWAEPGILHELSLKKRKLTNAGRKWDGSYVV